MSRESSKRYAPSTDRDPRMRATSTSTSTSTSHEHQQQLQQRERYDINSYDESEGDGTSGSDMEESRHTSKSSSISIPHQRSSSKYQKQRKQNNCSRAVSSVIGSPFFRAFIVLLCINAAAAGVLYYSAGSHTTSAQQQQQLQQQQQQQACPVCPPAPAASAALTQQQQQAAPAPPASPVSCPVCDSVSPSAKLPIDDTLCRHGTPPADWLPSSPQLKKALAEFQLLLDHPLNPMRSTAINKGGMLINHQFALWYMLKTVQPRPKNIIEIGIWKGHSSFVVNQAAPDAHYIAVDPWHQAGMNYKDPKGTYIIGDKFREFNTIDWEKDYGISPSETLVIDDAHANMLYRLRRLKQQGFAYAIFDDNVNYYMQDNYSLRHMCNPFTDWPSDRQVLMFDDFGRQNVSISLAEHRANREYLFKTTELYYEFPPIISPRYFSRSHPDQPYQSPVLQDLTEFAGYQRLLEYSVLDLASYFNICFIKIKK